MSKNEKGLFQAISYCVKDGNKENYYRKTINVSEPKCRVEGFEYKFNSEIELVAVIEPPRKKKGT